MISSLFKRDENGLVVGVKYIHNIDGTVNWRAMIPSEYLFVNPSREKEVVARYGRDIKELNPADIDDRYLLILLGGIKYLLRLRGFLSVNTEISHVNDYKAVATCTVTFIPNFETGGQPQTFADSASASMDSVFGTFRLFLETIAANRAFVRAVRNGLGINIVSADEFDDKASKAYQAKLESPAEKLETSSHTAAALLSTRCSELRITFDKLRERAIEIKADLKSDPNMWANFSSVQDLDAYILIDRINKSIIKKQKV